MPAAELSTRKVILRLLRRYMLPRWKGLTGGLLLAGLAAAQTGLLATLLQPATNGLLSLQGDFAPLAKLSLLLAALAVGRGLALIGESMLGNRVGLDLINSVQAELMGKLLHADLARLRAGHSGGFLSQVLNDTQTIRVAATTGMLDFAQSGLTVAILLAVMFTKDWLLTLFIIAAGPVIAWVLRDFSKRTNKAQHSSMDANAALATTILESLDGVRVVKMECREDREQARLAQVLATRKKVMLMGSDAQGMAAPVSEILTMVLVAVVIGYAGWRVHMPVQHFGPLTIGKMTIGGFTAFLVALMAAGQSLRQFASVQTTLTMGLAGARRLFAALDIEPEVRDAPNAKPLPRGAGTLRFEAVSFAYGDGPLVLEDLTLEARRGEIVALVGPSGGGKTTTLALIPRFYDVGAGRVIIDDFDVRDVTLASLRSQMAFVTQEPFLFDDTIGANIAYGSDNASQDEIEAAARQAAAHDFIQALPRGYDSLVGEAGLRLSGGQRQRIAIARAFLKNAPILLLDEATSALDTESERLVQQALERLMAGRTTIVIAHRLSTVRHADRIYVIDHGRLTETGAHADLVRLGGLYARLAGAQNLDLAPEPV